MGSLASSLKQPTTLTTKLLCHSYEQEDVVDQKIYFEESCKPKCVKPLLEYQACVKRIQDDESGHKHCTGQYFDYWHCVDKCVGPKLFAKLK
ncbi:Ubiquinol-cytochrome C reductase hinge domain superfamily [Arabidopsis suecica]|uniref:Complex III subunit VI n=1 Tax=Arabidopsis suecica TaxID=45249 RepID=A0A8T2FUZ1_ARASU|nr:Ubiquinol-cytochrome C reductase hinge domain superfamily [Arabidopsis suecica]